MKFRILAAAATLSVAASGPSAADDILDTLDAARAAYEAGDINTAKAELEFATQLLAQIKAEGLQAFLPAPMPGWTFEANNDGAGGMAFGGGAFAGGRYAQEGGASVEIQIIAGNQFVSSMAAMFSNPALMGASGGKVARIAGQRFAISPEGEITGMIGQALLQVSGDATVEEKSAYIEAMRLDELSKEVF